MRIQAEESVLLVVDIQGRLLPAIHDGVAVLVAARWLLGVARALGVATLATEQYPQGLGKTAAELQEFLPPENVIEKIHFSAVSEGKLLAHPLAARRQWVVVGTEAHVCVQQTVLDLLAQGRQVFVVDAAVGSRQVNDKTRALARMQQNGAEIVTPEMVAFEWLAQANTPLFRQVLKEFIR